MKTEVARCWAVVPAAGIGSRMGGEQPKQYLRVAGVTLLEFSLRPLLACPEVVAVAVALHPEDAIADTLGVMHDARVRKVTGGEQRSDSVLAGLEALLLEAAEEDWVLVHDAARPCLPPEDVARLIEQVMVQGTGGVLAEAIVDTVKQAGTDGQVSITLDRSRLWCAQTPQMFQLGQLRDALLAARDRGLAVTDEASAMELAGHAVQLVTGSRRNLKVTTPADLQLARWYLGQGEGGTGMAGQGSTRIGHGYDVHRFGPGDGVILGGVPIPHDRGLLAHSDGDVLIHAICDALLGAIGQGDIGKHFPDTDPDNLGIDSRLLLGRVMQRVRNAGWALANMDATLVAQVPRMAPYIAAMRDHLAADMDTPVERVNVKATTTEKLGFTGREEGIAAYAVVLLEASG